MLWPWMQVLPRDISEHLLSPTWAPHKYLLITPQILIKHLQHTGAVLAREIQEGTRHSSSPAGDYGSCERPGRARHTVNWLPREGGSGSKSSEKDDFCFGHSTFEGSKPDLGWAERGETLPCDRSLEPGRKEYWGRHCRQKRSLGRGRKRAEGLLWRRSPNTDL